MKTMYEVYTTREVIFEEVDCDDVDEVIAFIRDWAKEDFEAGHPLSSDDYDTFAQLMQEEGYDATSDLFNEYFNAFDCIREASYDEEPECEIEYSYELRKVEFSDDTESGEETFNMCGGGSEEWAIAYDTLEEAIDVIGDDICDANIRMPGTGVKVVAINGVPVPDTPDRFLAWTDEELEIIRDAGGNV